MSKEDIAEGLRVAIDRGESLEQAMTSFYNSGYEKAEIEEAAKIIQTKSSLFEEKPKQNFKKLNQKENKTREDSNFQQKYEDSDKGVQEKDDKNNSEQEASKKETQSSSSSDKKSLPQLPEKKNKENKNKKTEKESYKLHSLKSLKSNKSKISEYGNSKPSNLQKNLIILIVVLVLLLIGITTAIFMFKSEISSFLNSLF